MVVVGFVVSGVAATVAVAGWVEEVAAMRVVELQVKGNRNSTVHPLRW